MAPWLAVSEELINSVTDEFPAYSYVGLYNLLYLAPPHDDVLCATCATKRFRNGEQIVYGTYDEGPDLRCEDCGAVLTSSYGDPAEQDSD